jgi:hypothetical protein
MVISLYMLENSTICKEIFRKIPILMLESVGKFHCGYWNVLEISTAPVDIDMLENSVSPVVWSCDIHHLCWNFASDLVTVQAKFGTLGTNWKSNRIVIMYLWVSTVSSLWKKIFGKPPPFFTSIVQKMHGLGLGSASESWTALRFTYMYTEDPDPH